MKAEIYYCLCRMGFSKKKRSKPIFLVFAGVNIPAEKRQKRSPFLNPWVMLSKIWRPRNYTGRFSGEVTLKDALTRSLNAATVNLALQVGLPDIIETARQVGIQSKLHAVYPTVLGASEVTLLELVAAYGALATGRRLQPVCMDRILDRGASTIWEPAIPPVTILPAASVAAMRDMLAAVVSDGTARRALSLERPVYGKTGTTNANADALFIGFDDTLVVGVWVGRDDREPIGPKETGARAALPIWVAFMQQAPAQIPQVAALRHP